MDLKSRDLTLLFNENRLNLDLMVYIGISILSMRALAMMEFFSFLGLFKILHVKDSRYTMVPIKYISSTSNSSSILVSQIT